MSDPNGVTITLKDVYVELSKLRDTVNALTPQSEQLADHESRLRGLEKWKYALPTSVILAITSVIVTIMEVKH